MMSCIFHYNTVMDLIMITLLSPNNAIISPIIGVYNLTQFEW